MPTNVREELETLIRARYPIVYILSWEEARVEEAVQVVANTLERKVITWSLTQGMNPQPPGFGQNPHLVPELEVLTQINSGPDQCIYLIKDYHPYMSDYRVIRVLRDLAEKLRPRKQTILIVSPLLKLPPELEKEITVLDFGLPTAEEIEQKLNDVIMAVRENPQLDVNLAPEAREAIIHAAQGLTLEEIESVFARSLVRRRMLDVSEILVEKQQIIRKSGILEYSPPEVTMADVGGLDLMKEWLRQRRTAFTQKARAFGLPSPKGVLLIGVQGGGKSLSAKAVAALWNLPLLRMDMGKVFSGIVGSSEENMRKALSVAESVSPCVLWIDELEKGLAGVQSSSFSDAGTTARVFATFLTWMQEKSAPVFLVATANDVSMLPPELMRKGRFDEIFFIDLPHKTDRQDIISIHLKKRKRDPAKFDLVKVAVDTEGFSGAEIEQVIVGALFTAFDANRELTTDDLVAEAKAVVPLSKMMKEDIDELRDWAHLRARPASKSEE